LGPAAAAISHHTSSSMPKNSAPPVIRWTMDIIIVSSGL
jgi:hypothetical protein